VAMISQTKTSKFSLQGMENHQKDWRRVQNEMKFDSMQFLFREELSKIIIDFGIVGPSQAPPTKTNRKAYRGILLNLDFQ
jgi:hypothetical protein